MSDNSLKEINKELIKLYEYKSSINNEIINNTIKNIKLDFLISFINDPLTINNFINYINYYNQNDILLLLKENNNKIENDNSNKLIKKLIDNINNNYNPYEKKNTLFKNVYKNEWDDTIKNLSDEDKKIELFVKPIENNNIYQMNIPNIKNFGQKLIGGKIYDQYEVLGINITKKKEASRTSDRYVVTSLFDSYFNNNTLPPNKNINHYAICLYESIKLYINYLPNYNIRIYGDKSIDTSINKNKHLIKLFELINSSDRIEYYEVLQKVDDQVSLMKDNKHIQLLGALFRFYALLDPSISHIISVDADNFPTESLKNIINDWEQENKNNLLIFKPLFYSRKNINNKCIQQILAGMCGFKKEVNKIINPEIFLKIFQYIDKMYLTFKDEYIDYCDNNTKIKYDTPFRFGFEEQAITNILIPYYLLQKQEIIIIPMFFDFGKGYNFYYNEILSNINNKYKNIIKNKLGITIENTNSLCYVDSLYGYNIHIGIILCGFIDKCLNNNRTDIFNEGSIDKMKRLLSIKGFYSIYPSFNIMMTIDNINKYIDELYNGTNDLEGLSPQKLPKEAANEFGSDSKFFYQNIIDENLKNNDIYMKKPVLNILTSSKLYNKKYLKYKQKYIELKQKLRK